MKSARILLTWFALVGVATALPAGQLTTRNGRYIDLTTDLENANQIETLVESFDAAAEQWFEFWKVDQAAVGTWRVSACVMADEAPFRQQNLIPDAVPDFPFGYTIDDHLWVRVQPSQYYTRHLLLHEGAHSLAFHLFGGAGPTWYMEGTAEMLATHAKAGNNIQINRIPLDREQVPYWGRFRMIDRLRREERIPPIEKVMQFQPQLFDNVAPYSLSWAAAMMFHRYPNYNETFYAAARRGRDAAALFNRRFYQRLRRQWPTVRARWHLLTHELDYGFDWQRHRVDLSADDPLWNGQAITAMVAAEEGWQSAGVRFAPGTKLNLIPSGEVILETEPKPWLSHPPGVTIRYHRGRPLGQLLVCILPNAAPDTEYLQPLQIVPLPESQRLEIDEFSWLLFRVNDAPGDLANNDGTYEVVIDND